MKGDFDESMQRIFETREAYERSLPDRLWVQTKNGWMSKDRKIVLDSDYEGSKWP